eukprot:gene387-454_t
MEIVNKIGMPNINLKFKFDTTLLKKRIDDVANDTKKTFNQLVGVSYRDPKAKESKYYYNLKNDTAPSLSEEEFMGMVPKGFFEKNFDTTKYILDLLPSNDADFASFLDKSTNEFTRSMDYVNSKLFSRVRKNYKEFVAGMSQIREIDVELQRTAFLVMAKYRKRSLNERVLCDLTQIKGIVVLEGKLRQSLSDGDYPTTIKLCIECRNTITQYSHYSCIPELNSNLEMVYKVVQERIDKDFFNSCRDFNATTYQRVFDAYKLLGRADRILDKLKEYFVDPIEPETRNIVYAHVLLSENNSRNPEQFKGADFNKLSKSLEKDNFVNCLLAVFEYLCDVMTSLYFMNQFHEENPMEEQSKIFSEINSALQLFKNTIWDTMQKQVNLLLKPRNLTMFRIDDFLLILNSVTKLSIIGEEFSGSRSHHLRKSITDQSKTYFEDMHKKSVENLRIELENEMWDYIPLTDFDASTELRLGKLNALGSTTGGATTNDHIFADIRSNGNPFSQLISYKNKRPTTSPTLAPVKTPATAPADDSDDDDDALKQEHIEDGDEPHTRGNNNSNNNKAKKADERPKPIMASTTISFVRRYIGKYLELMDQLPHISGEIFQAICQLVEYYMFTIYSFSGYLDPQGFSLEALTTKIEKLSERPIEDLSFTKPALHRFINRMRERVGLPISGTGLNLANITSTGIPNMASLTAFTSQLTSMGQSIKSTVMTAGTSSPTLPGSHPATTTNAGPVDPNAIRWVKPNINLANLRLGEPKILFNLPLRVLAIESLSAVVEAMRSAKPVFQAILPSNQADAIKDFYASVVDVVPDLQRHLLKSAVSAIFSHVHGPAFFSNTIASAKWDLKTMSTAKTPYVDVITGSIRDFLTRLEACATKTEFINGPVKLRIIEMSLEYLVQQIVDGYSRVKKCSNEGRATMMQDLMSIKTGVESLRVKIPNISYAEHYLKGYYQFGALSEADILEWAKVHDEYPMQHIIALIQLAKINKPTLIQQLIDLDTKRRASK